MENIIKIKKTESGDYIVDVLDIADKSVIPTPYLCRGYDSAMETAKEVKKDIYPQASIYKVVDGESIKVL